MSLDLILKMCGVTGIIASLGVLIADILLYGRADSFDRLPGLKRAIGFPFWRLNIGNAIGVCLIPVVILGFVPLYYAIKPFGFFPALLTTGLLAYFFGLGPSAHTFTANLCLINRARGNYFDNAPEADVLDSVLRETLKMFNVLFVIMSISVGLGSLFYSAIVATGKTYLPVWMAALNPYFLIILATYSQKFLPATIAGYLVPTRVYVGFIPLLILTLVYMWDVI